MRQPTVAAGFVRGLMQFAVSKGASEVALTQRSGVDPASLLDQDSRIALASYVALLRASKVLCNDPALALHFGEALDMSDISIVGLISGAAETVFEAFTQVNRYHDLVVEVEIVGSNRFEFERGAGGLWIVDRRRNPNDFPELTESSFARMICGSRRFARAVGALPEDHPMPPFADAAAVKAVHVTHSAPAHHAEYERVLQAPVTFDSDKNAFLIGVDEGWLSRRLSLQRGYVFGVLSRHADALLERLKKSKTMRAQVESLMLPILHSGDIAKDAIAAKLGIGPDTLLRRLKAEGTTFERVLDELRHKMALHYLEGQKVSATETAYLVGFSEVAAFSRAFKRWTGKSPRALRAARHDEKPIA